MRSSQFPTYFFLILLLTFLLCTGVRAQSTLTVCASGCDHTTISAAITAASTGDVIEIQDAVHTEAAIMVDKDLTLQGQGQTVTTVQAAASQADAEDGVFIVNEGLTVTFQNFTISNGNAQTAVGSSALRDGGGMYINCDAQSVVNLLNVTIETNRASGRGGGIYISGNEGNVSLFNCIIDGNETSSGENNDGGGIANAGADIFTLDQCSIINNSSGYLGGGVFSLEGGVEATFTNCTVANNTANLSNASFPGGGGGFAIFFGNFHKFINCTITGNTVAGTRSNSRGGGIYHGETSDFFLINTIVVNNSAGSNSDIGEDIYMSRPSPDFTQTTSLVGDCFRDNGGTCPTFSYTDATNIATTPSTCGLQTYYDINGSDAVGTGTAAGEDVPSADICGTTRSTPNSIGAFYLTNSTYTWTGAEDNNWGNVNNWDLGEVPGGTDAVFIPSTDNDPIVNTGFANIGSVFITGAELTLASGSITRIRDQDTGLRVASGGTVTVNGPLIISGQQSEGLNLSNGTLTISATGRVEITDSYASVGDGLLEVNGELVINDAVSNGLQLTGEGAIRIKETGSLEITNPANNGLVLTEEGSFEQLGTTIISGCGSNGLSIGEETTCTISGGAEVFISDCVEALIRMSDETAKVTNRGMLSLTEPGNFTARSGSISNEDGSALVLEGTLTSSLRAKAGSTLQIGADIGRTFHNAEADFRDATVVIDIEGTTIGNSYDAIDFNSSVNLTEATLVLAGDYSPQLGDVFSIHTSSTSMASLTGIYSGLPDGTTLLFNGAVLEISYQSGPENVVELTCIAVPEPPVNDSLANAIVLELGEEELVAGENAVAATNETNESACGATRGWWYTFTPERTTEYILLAVADNLAGIDPPLTDDNDVTLGLYQGTTFPLTEIACFDNDDSGGGGEVEIVTLTAGETYFLRVGAKSTASVADIITTVSQLTKVWTGGTSSSWSEASNWQDNYPAVSGDNVIISTGTHYPVIVDGENVSLSQLSCFSETELTVNEGGQLTVTGDSQSGLFFPFSTLTVSGTVDVLTDATYGISGSGGELVITETGKLTASGTGVFLNGRTTVAGTLLALDAPEIGLFCLGDSLVVTATGTVEVANTVNEGVRLLAPLRNDGTMRIANSGAAGLAVANDGTVQVRSSGTLSIAEPTDVAISLESTDTLFNGGVLQVAFADESFAGGVIDNAGGAKLSCVGDIASELRFSAGSRFAPGDGENCTAFSTTPSFAPSAVYSLDIQGTDVCQDYAEVTLDVVGSLDGVILELEGDYVPEVGDQFSALRNNGASALGTFTGLPEGATLEHNGITLAITYQEGSGNDVLLTAISVVLPLDLLSFTGETRDKTNLLRWTTANEEDFSHFEVQRSSAEAGAQRPDSSADRWGGIAEISDRSSSADESGLTPASADERSYTFTDHSPLPTAYYRLKMVDLDGSYSYSPIISLQNPLGGRASSADELVVYPNPNNGQFTVELSLVSHSADQPAELKLMDRHGRTVWSATAAGRQPFSVDLSQAVPGVYLLLATPNSNTISQRIIIR